MPRNTSSAMEAALAQRVVRCALFTQLGLADKTLYIWTGIGPMSWNGAIFTGVGSLGNVSTISEGSTVEAQGITLTLDGLANTNVSGVLDDVRILGKVNLWLALFDADYCLVPDPFLSWSGFLDKPSLVDSAKDLSCTITAEHALVDLNRPCYRRFTADDQQLDLATTLSKLGLPSSTTDTGFRFVATIQEHVTFWGVDPSSTNNV